MTTTPSKRRMLPLLTDGPHGSRSAATCFYRCGNACDHPEPNTSGNTHVSSIIEKALARRTVLAAAGVGAGALVIGGLANNAAAGPRVPRSTAAAGGWTPVAPNVRDTVTVPDGYRTRAVINWGDPVLGDAPAFDPFAQTEESAAKQFGYNSDYVGVLPINDATALLVVNHEYTNEELMFPAGVYTPDEIRRIAIQSHGLSVVKIQRVGGPSSGQWRQADPENRYNRRITGTTQFEMTGPAAGHDRLRTTADPSGRKVLGTFNNCAGGQTPWGTVLSGEENFNQYFGKSGALDARYTTSYARYGISGTGDRGWKSVDPRFDLTAEPHEPFRFGWIVEIDPFNPTSTPRKHTMLGRFKHEGANIQIAADGRAVAYMGDDERGDYMYKFVSADTFDARDTQASRLRNMQLLTRGTLYVARLTGDDAFAVDASGNFTPADGEYDGLGTWIPLTSDTTSYVAGMSVAEVLIDTRLAADKVAPTRMDRPEDVQPNPVNGKIYAALTNNSDRAKKWPVDEANPIASSYTRPSLGAPLTKASGNRNGYVLEITEGGGDHTGTSFAWTLLLVCGDPESPETYFSGFPKDQVSPISCPDNVAFDSVGNLWISTDGAVLGGNDGLFRCPVAGTERGHVQQFLTVPVGAETCGPLITHDDLSVWVAVQHPGEGTGSTFATPDSTWPHTHEFPRPGVVVTWKA
ncbi:PhoX family protein [Nocardioides cavernaquae]|uniref:PhoX family phosphatase n=1 Tax=Nocardioides cavernaquae TaxID=2321396 RepID=A0A3A5HB30_9ACTN|nr:PhoX family phosphatase [Nocardioides cavernaquae]RJS47849.1 PhoX family phosphatase [Nocardioides cavernaquae]